MARRPEAGTRRPAGLVAVALVAALVAAPGPGPGTGAAGELSRPIVFVRQKPLSFTFATISDVFGNFTSFDPADGQPVGGGLYRLDPDGTETRLVRMRRIAVRDPEISWDGETVVFAMKTRPRGPWQVWTVGVDGKGLEKVSRKRRFNDWDPAFLPDGRILFVSDRLRWADSYENLPEGQLFVMDADGGGVRELAASPQGIFNPLLGQDGLIYFTQWDFHDCRDTIVEDNCELDANRFLLWKVAIDGSREGHPDFGDHTVYDFSGGYFGIREDPRRKNRFFATLADEFFTYGAGALVRMRPRRDGHREKPRYITPRVFGVGPENEEGRYRDPFPLADGRLVAAYAPGKVFDDRGVDSPDFDLVLVDRTTGAAEPLLEDPESWLLQPVEVRARPAPELAPGSALPGFDYAVVNAKDVTLRNRNCDEVLNGDCQPYLEAGEVAAIRIHQVKRTPNFYREFRDYSSPRQELLGEVPVRPDGSFAAAVPAPTSLIWEAIDAAGNVLVEERFWSEVVPGEARVCSGCHSPHDKRRIDRPNSALRDVTNLSGKNVDRDGDGLVDLLEALGLVR